MAISEGQDSTDTVYVFCDGGCRGNQKKENVGGWGVFMKRGQFHEHKMNGSKKNTTNNEMELVAVIEALKFLGNKKRKTIVIVDSNYVYSGITSWIYGWIERGWKTKSKSPVKNAKLWKELLSLKLQFENIKFELCKGHSEIEGNEIADHLANKAMDDLEKFESTGE